MEECKSNPRLDRQMHHSRGGGVFMRGEGLLAQSEVVNVQIAKLINLGWGAARSQAGKALQNAHVRSP